MHLACSVSLPGTVKLFHRNAGLFTNRRTRLWAVYISSSCENVKIRLLIFLSFSLSFFLSLSLLLKIISAYLNRPGAKTLSITRNAFKSLPEQRFLIRFVFIYFSIDRCFPLFTNCSWRKKRFSWIIFQNWFTQFFVHSCSPLMERSRLFVRSRLYNVHCNILRCSNW